MICQVEKMGRRNLLLMGAIGYVSLAQIIRQHVANAVTSMCVCQFIVAIVGTVSSVENLSAQRASIAFV